MKFPYIEVVSIIILTYAIPAAVPHYLQLRPNPTLRPNDAIVPGEENCEEVSLIKPKFKSKKLAGLDWSSGSSRSSTDSSSAQTRHLDWVYSSEDDSQNAEPTEKSYISQFFEDEEDEDSAMLKDKSADRLSDKLRQRNRKKYVKVDKMIFPLLLAYKLKFFTMVPLLIGALILLVSSTGLAGFFFALFAAAAGLHHHKGAAG